VRRRDRQEMVSAGSVFVWGLATRRYGMRANCSASAMSASTGDSARVCEVARPNSITTVLILDEMWRFVNGKKRRRSGRPADRNQRVRPAGGGFT